MERENIVIISVIAVIILLLWGWQSGFLAKIFLGGQNPVTVPEGIILFYGEGCPHCKNVDDFIAQNGIKDKVKFENLEVWYNKDNQAIIGQVAQKCGVDSKQVGVPFLYDGISKCYVGDVDVINFFKNEAEIQ